MATSFMCALNVPESGRNITAYTAMGFMGCIREHVQPTMFLYILQSQYALLLVCVAKEDCWCCLVRNMEEIKINDQQLTNEYDCPLLTLSPYITAISPHSILTSLSVVHECTNTCTFIESHATRRVEREVIQENRTSLIFNHDWSNDIYALNIFCMNQ